MLSAFETSRPLPPAKVRRATSVITNVEVDSTPPPAYGSPMLVFRNGTPSDFGADIFKTPIGMNRRFLSSWDESPSRIGEESSPAEHLECVSEKSREEVHDLLVKAHGIIKDREHGKSYLKHQNVWLTLDLVELGLATNIVKRVYDHNAVLKSKHEALLAKIPMSPSPSLSHSPSPDSLSTTMHLSHSASEFNLTDSPRTHVRKISIARADISLLADQNAELLSKLQKLEEDAMAADIAGRRELKKLGKEIVYLRDALEKTQAKSEELEGKVQNAVTNEAVRKKKERKAMRNAARDNKTEGTVLDFAPPGSKFGGPSERYSLLDLPQEENHFRNDLEPSVSDPNRSDDDVVSDRTLVARLLSKVKELEEANARILRQQVETSNQLAHVQRDTLNMTKVYELLSDHDVVELELEPEDVTTGKLSAATESRTIRFRSLRKHIENNILQNESFVFPKTHGSKARKTVLGLFEGSVANDETNTSDPEGSVYSHPSELSGATSGTFSGSTASLAVPLSPLDFFSSNSQSDNSHGRTLQNELDSIFGQGIWNLSGQNHMRTDSLSNLSQFSAPAPGSSSPMLPNELEGSTLPTAQSEYDSGLHTPRHTPKLPAVNPLRLSVEPPTPDDDTNAPRKHVSRLQNMSLTLRSRKNRLIERMSIDGNSQQAVYSHLAPSLKASRQNSDGDDEHFSHLPSRMTILQAQPGLQRSDEDEDVQTSTRKRDEDLRLKNESFLFQLWLWIQFAIVVLIFVFAMVRNGPGVVLGDTEGVGKKRRAVSNR